MSDGPTKITRYRQKHARDDKEMLEHPEGEFIKWADLQRQLDNAINRVSSAIPDVHGKYRTVLESQLVILTLFKQLIDGSEDADGND